MTFSRRNFFLSFPSLHADAKQEFLGDVERIWRSYQRQPTGEWYRSYWLTLLQTLSAYPESTLYTMLTQEKIPPSHLDEHGNIRIDEDPKVFKEILSIYRAGCVPKTLSKEAYLRMDYWFNIQQSDECDMARRITNILNEEQSSFSCFLLPSNLPDIRESNYLNVLSSLLFKYRQREVPTILYACIYQNIEDDNIKRNFENSCRFGLKSIEAFLKNHLQPGSTLWKDFIKSYDVFKKNGTLRFISRGLTISKAADMEFLDNVCKYLEMQNPWANVKWTIISHNCDQKKRHTIASCNGIPYHLQERDLYQTDLRIYGSKIFKNDPMIPVIETMSCSCNCRDSQSDICNIFTHDTYHILVSKPFRFFQTPSGTIKDDAEEFCSGESDSDKDSMPFKKRKIDKHMFVKCRSKNTENSM